MKYLIAFLLLISGSLAFACDTPSPPGTMCIRWTAPTEDVLGNPITLANIDHFTIYWDTVAFSTVPSTAPVIVPDPASVEFSQPATSIGFTGPPRGGWADIYARMTATDVATVPPGPSPPGESILSNQMMQSVFFPVPAPGEPTILEFIISL
jgi:hypothetical protein